MTVLLTLVVAVGAVPAGIRWLRVAQREHYLAGWVSTFARRWTRARPANAVLMLAMALATVAATEAPAAALVAAAAAVVFPLGLGLRGRTSPLRFTRRLRTTAAATALLVAAIVAVGLLAGFGPAAAAGAVWAVPALVDLALLILAPVERRLSARWTGAAAARLRQVDPTTVAITGSFGKTTIKVLVRHLLEGSVRVVASPASFNNAAGLSRAVNEQLRDDTEVFVAEMGMYGPGEIRALCRWVRPDVSVICNIGPVHLERLGSLDAIVAAKSEIVETAEVAVINVDAHGLAAVADRLCSGGRRVVRCSTGAHPADVTVERTDGSLTVAVDGEVVAGDLAIAADASNVACALGIVLALGVDLGPVIARLDTLPTAEHRRQAVTAPSGLVVIDDTYNANPAGAAAALDLLTRVGAPAGRRVVVTPGMIELGSHQDEANATFAADAAAVADHVLIVGLTNRASLRRGTSGTGTDVHQVATRDEAVTWVRAHLAGGDAVLYENDLPDHFP